MIPFTETSLPECRPDTVPPARREGEWGGGHHADPDVCEHPVEARVWPHNSWTIARCRDCGSHLTKSRAWVVAP